MRIVRLTERRYGLPGISLCSNKYKTKNLGVLNNVMFIGEPGGSNRSRGLLLEEIRYTFRHKSFTTESRNDSLSHGTTIHLYIVSHNDDLS